MYSVYPLQLSAGKVPSRLLHILTCKIVLFLVNLCDFRQAQHSKSTATFTRDSLARNYAAYKPRKHMQSIFFLYFDK